MADTRYYAIHIFSTFLRLSAYPSFHFSKPVLVGDDGFMCCESHDLANVKCIITQPNVFENRWFTHFLGFKKSVDNVDKLGLDKSLCLFVQSFKK